MADAGLTTKAVNPDAPPTIPAERFGCHIGAGLIAADVDELTAALVTSRSENGEFGAPNVAAALPAATSRLSTWP